MGVTRNLIRFDWAMKRLLRNKANFKILEGFVSELLNKDISILELGESEGNQESSEDKFNRVDIIASLTTGEIIIVEVQAEDEVDYFHRMLYGVSKALIERIHKREKYGTLKKVYSVNIVYFELGQGEDYVYHGGNEFRGIHKTDILQLSVKQKETFKKEQVADIFPEYYVLKVNTFDDIAKNSLDEWIYFLKNSEIPDEFRAKGLAEAREALREDRMNEVERLAYRQHLENLRYANSMMFSAKIEGKIEGRAEGKIEGRVEGRVEGELIGLQKGEQIGLQKGEQIGLQKGEQIKAYKTALKVIRRKMLYKEIAELTDLTVEIIEKLAELEKKYCDDAENHLDELIDVVY
ncbi:MAG: Rpn family recombination-promoting nuclease/putative transposase [Bacteroidia bacterium]|nr:Rpn family recombination-promoting nuclease/putative transposase [Bacteroidia bacterium]